MPDPDRLFSIIQAAPRRIMLLMWLVLPLVIAYPNQYSDAQLAQCATGNCPTAHGAAPAPGNALTVAGKTNGGTYTPGETITLTNSGGGQYALYATAGGVRLGRSNDQPTTITAPATGTLTLLSVRANARAACTYELMTLTPGGGGGGNPPIGGSPPPAGIGGGRQPPPPPLQGGGLGNSATDNTGTISGSTVGGALFISIVLGAIYVKYYKKPKASNGGVTMTQAPPVAPVPPPPPGAPGWAPPPSVPPGWQELKDPNSGHTYFYNATTGQSSWVRPGPDGRV